MNNLHLSYENLTNSNYRTIRHYQHYKLKLFTQNKTKLRGTTEEPGSRLLFSRVEASPFS